MKKRPLPSLSLDGWINDPVLKITNLYSHFVVSEYSQTMAYTGNVASLKWLLGKYGDDLHTLANEIENTLKDYVDRYFNETDVDVEIKPSNDDDNSFIIYIEIKTKTDDGKEISLTRINNISNMNINTIDNKITELNENYR